jgi:hypothetical protein
MLLGIGGCDYLAFLPFFALMSFAVGVFQKLYLEE